MRARLLVESGECTPSMIDLVPGQLVTIGRSRDNQLIIRDDSVSRLHAKIYNEGKTWYVRHFGLNPTVLNDVSVNLVGELSDHSMIQICSLRLRFQMFSGSHPAPTGGKTAVSSLTPPPEHPYKSNGSSGRLEILATKAHSNRQLIREIPKQSLSNSDTLHEQRLQEDEFEALVQFMTTAIGYSDVQQMLQLSLNTVLNQTSATLAGFLSLDPTEPLARLLAPDRGVVDVPLSKNLTEKIREKRRPYWLLADSSEDQPASQSLSAYSDAICLPIGGDDAEPIAAFHVYRTGRPFSERDFQFLSAMAAYLSPALMAYRYRRKLEAENHRLRGSSVMAEELIGDSSPMMNLRQQIGRSAPLPFTVLIQGESGSGKELVALTLHRNSPRADGPLVVVNCAAFAPSMLEAELFGYEKGAFAGADNNQPGFIGQAEDGTLFLDEVADLSLECQAKLLRVIEGRNYRPMGSAKDLTADVRIVAATKKDLEEEVRTGRFRQDLLFRLKVIWIKVPALRDHAEDIVELARFFLERLSKNCRRSFKLSPAAELRLAEYSWPGNVRQLRAVLESSAAMCENDILDVETLPLGPSPTDSTPIAAIHSADAPASLAMDDLETWAILKALRQTSGNVSQAARVLGISRDTLHTKLKRKQIDRESILAAPVE